MSRKPLGPKARYAFEVERHGWLPDDVAARRAEYESVDIAKVREDTFLPHREVH